MGQKLNSRQTEWWKIIKIHQETKKVTSVLKYEVDAFYLSKIDPLFTDIYIYIYIYIYCDSIYILASRPFFPILAV